MKFIHAALFAAFVALLTASSARAGEGIGVVKSYSAAYRQGTLDWENSLGKPVTFKMDGDVPDLKIGDRVRAVARPLPGQGQLFGPRSVMLTEIWVVGLAVPDPKRPAPKPAATPAQKASPPAPMGEVKTFNPAKGVGIFVPDGEYIGREFRPWPGFDFRPMNGARLFYAEDQQFGQKILWVAPQASAEHP